MDAVYDVAVVGFGPSGAVAANLLGQAGLSVYVCDRQHEVYAKPRAIALDHEIMRVFQQLGLVEAIQDWVEPFTPSEYFGVDGQLIRRMTMVAPPYPLGHTPSMVFTQPPVEQVLRDLAASMENVRLDRGVELQNLAEGDGLVTLQVHTQDGQPRTVHARHVIGCDGASSTVRALAGLALEDLDFDEPWLVVDVLVNARGLAKLPTTSVQYCEPERPCSLVIGPKNHRRWEIALHANEDPLQATTPEATWRLLSRWLTPEDGELWRQASYRFHALVATDWRKGRVFIAGDAAHQQPPFLGQGMCQGVRDVANLAWKLIAVATGSVTGPAANALLDSYALERREHVRSLTTRIKAIGAVICERDVTQARARDAKLLAECGGAVQDTPRQNVLPRLESGYLSATHSTARGTIFPQPRVHAGSEVVLLDTLAEAGWRLVLAESACAWPLQSTLPVMQVLRVTGTAQAGAWQETEGVLADWFARHRCCAAIVRPDHYVYAVAADAAQLQTELAELKQRWLKG
jgi:3-(3-hydroxy-phenyl)propionate hydroxylase